MNKLKIVSSEHLYTSVLVFPKMSNFRIRRLSVHSLREEEREGVQGKDTRARNIRRGQAQMSPHIE